MYLNTDDFSSIGKGAKKQLEALIYLKEVGSEKHSVLTQKFGASAVKGLIEKNIVAMAGFVSDKRMLRQMFGMGIAKLFYKRLWLVEQAANPDFVGYDAAQTLKAANIPALLIYCIDDPVVKVQYHRDVLVEALSGRENVHYLSMADRGHNPNYTPDAAAYLGEYAAALAKKRKAGELATAEQRRAFVDSWDWDRMTAQDAGVWREIFDALDEQGRFSK